nr:glycoside hydrolase family 95 protein [Gracilibacillus saliphilus]
MAMTELEHLQLNEDTLWSGYPRDGNNQGAKARKAILSFQKG